jgi:hypothetical protein
MAKTVDSGGRVNAAFVHGEFTFLSGEICASRDRRFMRVIRRRSIRLTNDHEYLFVKIVPLLYLIVSKDFSRSISTAQLYHL